MLEYHSIQSLVDAAQEKGCTISELVLADQSVQTETPKDELFRKMQDNLHVMQEAVQAGVDKDLKSTSGLTGGDAYKMQQYAQGGGLCGNFFTQALTRAIAVSEYNAAMGKIVAAPTAGSCGILPGTILSLMEDRDMPEETAVMALFTAGAFGMVIADRASIAGAQGGCQAECGSAAAMAAAAMVEMSAARRKCAHMPAPSPSRTSSVWSATRSPVWSRYHASSAMRVAWPAHLLRQKWLWRVSRASFRWMKSLMPCVKSVIPCRAHSRRPPGGLAVTPTGIRLKEEIFGA